MIMISKKSVMLVKTEATYGTDPTPSAATDAILAIDADIEEPTSDGGEEDIDFSEEEPVEEIVEELPLNQDDNDVPIDVLSPEMSGMVTGCQSEPPIDDEAVNILKDKIDIYTEKRTQFY